jgi:hypothetical protein
MDSTGQARTVLGGHSLRHCLSRLDSPSPQTRFIEPTVGAVFARTCEPRRGPFRRLRSLTRPVSPNLCTFAVRYRASQADVFGRVFRAKFEVLSLLRELKFSGASAAELRYDQLSPWSHSNPRSRQAGGGDLRMLWVYPTSHRLYFSDGIARGAAAGCSEQS